MKKGLLIIFTSSISFLSFSSLAQISFEKGYFIDGTGQKTECLIKNVEWKTNPTDFEFKLLEEGEAKRESIKSVKEFGIGANTKYIRHIVKIDRSGDKKNDLTSERAPKFQEEQLFMKALVEGKASLYVYEDRFVRRFFFTIDTVRIEQLIYKQYLSSTSERTTIVDNVQYKQQLWNSLQCTGISKNNIESIEYKTKALIGLFVNYNTCSQSEFINFEDKPKVSRFNLTIRPGLKSSSLSISNSAFNSAYDDVDFGTQLAPRFGIEAEFILPYNKNKWALLIEPTYQYFKSTEYTKVVGYTTKQTVTADYKSIELPVGIRHYFFLNTKSKLFLNASVALDIEINSKIDYEKYPDLEIKTQPNFAVGIGYNYNRKFSFEFRYLTKRDILGDYEYWKTNYPSFSAILGYTIF